MKTVNSKILFGILAISMLVLTDVKIMGLEAGLFCLFVLAMVQAVVWIIYIRKNPYSVWKKKYIIDVGVGSIFLWELLGLIIKLVKPIQGGDIEYQTHVIVMILTVFYFNYREINNLADVLTDLILIMGQIGNLMLVTDWVLKIDQSWFLGSMSADTGYAASYILVLCVLGTCKYCMGSDYKMKQWFYFFSSVISFFVLFLNHNIVSIWIMAFVFLLIPILYRATAELVKKDMQLCFAYFFLLSNMSLLTNYTEAFKEVTSYHLEQAVYIELMVAVGGVFFFHYWDRIPEGIDLSRLVVRKMRRGFLFTWKVLGILVIGLLLSADEMTNLSEGIMSSLINSFMIPLVEEIRHTDSLFANMIKNDPVTTVMILVFSVLMINKMNRNFSFGKQRTTMYILVSIVFFIQIFFYVPDRNLLPVYLLMVVMAAFGKEKNIRVSSIKINRSV